jgi:glycosyltransferase involved in cell wall biosynthesis
LFNIRKARIIYIWFADYHSLLPVLFAKVFNLKSYLVLAGYDVVSIPKLHYGSFKSPIRTFFSKYSIKYTSLNLAVVDSVAKDAIKKVPQAKIKILYTGYDKNEFFPAGLEKEKIVLTVATGNTLQRVKIKGIDVFCKLAKEMPKYFFIIIGLGTEAKHKLGNLPNNLKVIGKVPQKKLLIFYQKAKVYAQFSMTEGLPNVVCEAMLCECIPVGFNVGGIPIAIGDAGFISDGKDIHKLMAIIDQAMNADPNLGKKARKRIINKFPIEQRERMLKNLLNKSILN